jgi:hypothetical protein
MGERLTTPHQKYQHVKQGLELSQILWEMDVRFGISDLVELQEVR